MQHQKCAMAMPLSIDRWGLVAREAFERGFSPPRVPRTAGGLSGRPTCRIYPRGDIWILALDYMSGGWVDDRSNVSRRLAFPTLTAAIGYAERKGLDYQIERHRQHEGMRPRKSATGRLPRSWLARLARNEGSNRA